VHGALACDDQQEDIEVWTVVRFDPLA